MSLQENIESDHDKIKMLLSDIEALEEQQAQLRMPLFHKLKKEILILNHAQEEVLYDVVVKKSDSDHVDDLVDGLTDENETIESLLNDLENSDADISLWFEKFLRLKSKIIKHIDKDKELLPIVDKHLDVSEDHDAAEEISDVKNKQWDVEVLVGTDTIAASG